MEKFYRYQGTNQVEQCSYYVDVELLYEDVQELKRLNNTISKEQLRDELYWKYEKTLELRRDIQAETLFQKVCEATSWNEVWTISEKYPVCGIFGYRQEEVEAYYQWTDLMSGDLWNCESEKFLTLYEGECLQDEGESGVIFRPTELIKVWKLES